jgi:hypothetical protein
VGHVTVTGDDPADLLARARHAAAFLSSGYAGLTGEDEGDPDG